jgi:Flp pilus assembly protein TadD
MNYLEPPLWYYPVRQTLGALYFQTGKTKEAAQAFMQALIVRPNNAAALYGLKTVQEAMGDPAAAATAELLERAAVPGAKFSMDRL